MNENMNSTAQMAQLMRELKPQMNGAVTGAMEERGIVYPLNYGVSIPTIRTIASAYGPNHKLATLLYQQQVRELKLSAIIVAEPNQITINDADFWSAGIINSEVSEHIAGVIASCEQWQEIGLLWITDSRSDVAYAGLMSLAKGINKGNTVDTQIIISKVKSLLPASNHNLRRGLELLFVAIGKSSSEAHLIIKELCEEISQSDNEYNAQLSEEILWQIEC